MAKKAAELFLCIWILTFSVGATTIGPLPIKTIIFALFIISSAYALAGKGKILVTQKAGLAILFACLAFTANVGFLHGFDVSTLNQASSLIATFSMAVLSFLLYENNLLELNSVKRAIYISAASGVCIKAFLGLGVVLGFFAAENIDDLMQNYAGSTSFHADEWGGFLGLLPRIGNAGDLFNLVVFLFYIKRHDGAKVALAWVLMLIFVLVTYSRYLMLLFAVATAYAAGSNIRNRSKAATVALTLCALAATINYTEADLIYQEFEERFTGYTQSRSDAIREEMRNVLSESVENNPIFGIGLGGYIRDYLRSPTNLWQYELEYLSLLMQLGIFGFILIVMNFIFYTFRMILSDYNKYYVVPVAISLIFWVGTPIQSSLFSGTQSAVIVLSIFFLSRKSADQTQNTASP